MELRPHLLAAALVVGAALEAGAADRAGCRDILDLKRFERSSIALCDRKNFAEYRIPTGPLTEYEFSAKRGRFASEAAVEGRLSRNAYLVPPGPSAAEVFRNYKAELAAKGFTVLYEAKQAEMGQSMGSFFENDGPGGQLFGYSPDEARLLSAVKESGGANTHLLLYVIEYADGYVPSLDVAKGQVAVRLDVVESGEMKQQMVTVSAAEIARSLDQTGRVALYGIYFEFNKATLQPQSAPTLAEIATFLKSNPGQRIHVVGHTDNVGGVEPNQKLSEARAQSVVAELVRSYGIAQSRMRPAGVGLLAPVSSNATEDGRAKNRRVELLPQ